MENAIEKLDYTLNWLSLSEKKFRAVFEMIQDPYFKDYSYEEVELLIEKIAKDGYAIQREKSFATQFEGNKIFRIFKVNIEGLLFYKQGGYKEADRIKQLEITNLEIDVRTRRRNERLIVWGTWVAAVGVLIAAVYYIQEIGKYFHWW